MAHSQGPLAHAEPVGLAVGGTKDLGSDRKDAGVRGTFRKYCVDESERRVAYDAIKMEPILIARKAPGRIPFILISRTTTYF